MRNRHVRRHRLALPAVALLVAFLGALVAPSASADTQPADASLPATVSSDALPTVQIDGVVWSQVIVGNTVFVGGEFTTARPAGAPAGTGAVARSNFLAYNLTTGELLPFAPGFDAQVRALGVSPDQRTLYVGGQFTWVNGVPRYRIAAFDVATGELQAFAPTVNSSVYGFAVTDDTLYVAGIFTAVGGAPRVNAAALDRSSGAVKPFAVSPAGGSVRQLVISPDGTHVIVAGNFTSLNGDGTAYGLGMVDAGTGELRPMQLNSVVRNAGANAKIMSLAATPDGFYGTGYAVGVDDGNIEGAFKADWDGELTWLEDCHGDSYSVAPAGDTTYVAGHPHDCARVGGFPDTVNPTAYHRALAFTSAATGTLAHEEGNYHDHGGRPAPTLLHWFPDLNDGSYTGQHQGPWNVAASSDYVVYGGEFTKVNGRTQQGLVRFARRDLAPNADGPRLSGSTMGFTAASSNGQVALSLPADWDRDNTRLTYAFYRDSTLLGRRTDDSSFWSRPTIDWVDTGVAAGQTHSYRVKVSDPLGNTTASDRITVTVQ